MDYETVKLTHRIAVEVFTTGMIVCLIALLAYGGRAAPRRRGVLRLVRGLIYYPATLAYLIVLIAGVWMAYQVGWYTAYWFWAKMLFAFVLMGWVHGVVSKQLKLASREESYATPVKVVLALPLLLISIAATLYLVLLQPF